MSSDSRLYLDTGDLNRIADGREERSVVDNLRAAMVATKTSLVLSRAHLQDAFSRTDSATQERFVAMVESFQPVLLVMNGPEEVEPLSDDERDIGVEMRTNFREVAFSAAARPWLHNANVTQDEMHLGDIGAQAVRRQLPRSARRITNAAMELFVQSAVTLVRGWMGDDVRAIVAHWEEAASLSVSVEEEELIVVQLVALGALLEPLRATIERDELDVTAILRRLGAVGASPAAYPGQSLTIAVGSGIQRDVTRRRQRSDWVDLDHVSHFPYVDVATCDASTFHLVTPALTGVETPRQVVVVRNGNLREVVRLLEARRPRPRDER